MTREALSGKVTGLVTFWRVSRSNMGWRVAAVYPPWAPVVQPRERVAEGKTELQW